MELQLPVSQALALFVKIIRKITKRLVDIQKAAITDELPQATLAARIDGDKGGVVNRKPIEISVEDELNETANEVTKDMQEKQNKMIESLNLER